MPKSDRMGLWSRKKYMEEDQGSNTVHNSFKKKWTTLKTELRKYNLHNENFKK